MRRRGFMLIELAVASFVIGVAVLALAAVIHLGQRAATVSDGTTRAALFADDALATLRLLNDRAATDTDPAIWAMMWDYLTPSKDNPQGAEITQLTGFASGVWAPDQRSALPSLDTSPGIHTNYWCPARIGRNGGEPVRADFALRYAIDIVPGESMAVGNRREPRYYAVTLHVWSGTSLAAESSESTFFAVFANPRRMP